MTQGPLFDLPAPGPHPTNQPAETLADGFCPVCMRAVVAPSFLPDYGGLVLPPICRRHLAPAIGGRLGYVEAVELGHQWRDRYAELRRQGEQRRRARRPRRGKIPAWYVLAAIGWAVVFVAAAMFEHCFGNHQPPPQR